MKYWINTVSRDHVQRGVKGGFTQANHGKATMLQRLEAGDWIIFYSPKTSYMDGEPLQAFTAIGQVQDNDMYQVEMSKDFVPWRRNVAFYDCEVTYIKPLLDRLQFIRSKTHWGFKFRLGMFEIPEADFELIKKAMNVKEPIASI